MKTTVHRKLRQSVLVATLVATFAPALSAAADKAPPPPKPTSVAAVRG